MWGIAVLCGNLKLDTSSGMHAPLVGATLPAAGIAMRYPNSAEAGVECTTVPHVGHACEYVRPASRPLATSESNVRQ